MFWDKILHNTMQNIILMNSISWNKGNFNIMILTELIEIILERNVAWYLFAAKKNLIISAG